MKSIIIVCKVKIQIYFSLYFTSILHSNTTSWSITLSGEFKMYFDNYPKQERDYDDEYKLSDGTYPCTKVKLKKQLIKGILFYTIVTIRVRSLLLKLLFFNPTSPRVSAIPRLVCVGRLGHEKCRYDRKERTGTFLSLLKHEVFLGVRDTL